MMLVDLVKDRTFLAREVEMQAIETPLRSFSCLNHHTRSTADSRRMRVAGNRRNLVMVHIQTRTVIAGDDSGETLFPIQAKSAKDACTIHHTHFVEPRLGGHFEETLPLVFALNQIVARPIGAFYTIEFNQRSVGNVVLVAPRINQPAHFCIEVVQ